MRINHNIQALNAYRNLHQNQNATSKNLEKLSSGLRINRAADDAAGLAISEKMRSQIRGLKQAERNSLDGISLMQTSEGAMTEVHSMIQRMRQLAVQAANDTNTYSDRLAIQKEVDNLLTEIDSIAQKTEFNTRRLLDGSSAVDTQFLTGEIDKTNIKGVPTVVDPSLATGPYEIALSNTEYVRSLNQPGAGVSDKEVMNVNLEAIYQRNQQANTNLDNPPEITDSTLAEKPGTYRINVESKTWNAAVTSFTNTSVALGSSDTNFIVDRDNSELPMGKYKIVVDNYVDTNSDGVSDDDVADISIYGPNNELIGTKAGVTLDSSDTDVTNAVFGTGDKQVALNLSGIDSNGEDTVTVSANLGVSVDKLNSEGMLESTIVSSATFTTNDEGKVDLQESGTSKFKLDIPSNVVAGSSKFDITSDLGFGEYSIIVSDYQVDENGNKSANIEVLDPDGFSIGETASKIGDNGEEVVIGSEVGKTLKIDTTKITQAGTVKVQLEGKMEVEVSKVNADNTTTPITFNKEITTRHGLIVHGGMEMEFGINVLEGASKFDLTNKALAFQIGANTNQSVNIDIPELSTVKLGIDEISVLSYEDANEAIFKLESALTDVSSVRAKLGAMQNRLEHTISNLQVTHENLTAAESRVRDTDMAKEMTEFTKNNILNQSAQAMLAQANQLPQGVLQLLQ